MSTIELVEFDEIGTFLLTDSSLLEHVSAAATTVTFSLSETTSNSTCGTDVNRSCGNINESCIVGFNNVCGSNRGCAGIGV